MNHRKRFRHLGAGDRDRIEALLQEGHRQKTIAGILKVDPSTISREIRRRRKDGRYDADTAEHKARVKRSNSKYQGMKVEGNRELRMYVIRELQATRSPDEIAGRMRRDRRPGAASKDAVYHWLYSAWGARYTHLLCTKRWRRRKQKRPRAARVMIPERVSIHARPRGAANRTRYGHFEGDTAVAAKRAKNTEAVAVAAERKSKLFLATRIPSLAPSQMTGAVARFARAARMATLTLDNGIENRDHRAWMVRSFFADPHSPWQKPVVENGIGLLRRWFFPKGTDWAGVSEERLQEAVAVINNKYRKSLGYQNALEVASAHGIIQTSHSKEIAFRVRI